MTRLSCLLLDVGETRWLLPVSAFSEVLIDKPAGSEMLRHVGCNEGASIWAMANTASGLISIGLRSTPRLLQLSEADLVTDAHDLQPGELARVQVLGELAIIPDLESLL